MKTRGTLTSALVLILISVFTVTKVFARGISDEDKQGMFEGDYLLTFRDIVKSVTAFTLGHSQPAVDLRRNFFVVHANPQSMSMLFHSTAIAGESSRCQPQTSQAIKSDQFRVTCLPPLSESAL